MRVFAYMRLVLHKKHSVVKKKHSETGQMHRFNVFQAWTSPSSHHRFFLWNAVFRNYILLIMLKHTHINFLCVHSGFIHEPHRIHNIHGILGYLAMVFGPKSYHLKPFLVYTFSRAQYVQTKCHQWTSFHVSDDRLGINQLTRVKPSNRDIKLCVQNVFV